MVSFPNLQDATDAALELRRAFDTARASWPTLSVSFEEFCGHLDRLGPQRELPTQLSAFYLCLACSLGREGACRLLELHHFPALRAFLTRFDSRSDVIDELFQQLRYRLFVGPAPRIRTYRGAGSLDGWLRKIAVTLAVDFLRSHSGAARRLARFAQDATYFEHSHGASPIPQDEHVYRARHAKELARALRHSLRQLSPEQHQLLHHHYVSNLTIDQLSTLYGCDRSTAARRILRSVRTVQRTLREELSRMVPKGIDLEGWAPVLCRAETQEWLTSKVCSAQDGR
jgi:RNA polymerase sigma-70 factor